MSLSVFGERIPLARECRYLRVFLRSSPTNVSTVQVSTAQRWAILPSVCAASSSLFSLLHYSHTLRSGFPSFLHHHRMIIANPFKSPDLKNHLEMAKTQQSLVARHCTGISCLILMIPIFLPFFSPDGMDVFPFGVDKIAG